VGKCCRKIIWYFNFLSTQYNFKLKVQSNVKKAQEKQKKDFAKKKAKGVKVFQHSVGDLVLRKVMKNISRKGGKLDALWTGPYRYVVFQLY